MTDVCPDVARKSNNSWHFSAVCSDPFQILEGCDRSSCSCCRSPGIVSYQLWSSVSAMTACIMSQAAAGHTEKREVGPDLSRENPRSTLQLAACLSIFRVCERSTFPTELLNRRCGRIPSGCLLFWHGHVCSYNPNVPEDVRSGVLQRGSRGPLHIAVGTKNPAWQTQHLPNSLETCSKRRNIHNL